MIIIQNLIKNVGVSILVQHQVLCLATLTLPHPCNLFMELVPHKPASPPFKVSQCIAMAQTTIQLRAIKTDYGELCAHLLNWLSWWMLLLWIDRDQLTCTMYISSLVGSCWLYSLSKAKRPKGPPARSRGLEGPKTSSLS